MLHKQRRKLTPMLRMRSELLEVAHLLEDLSMGPCAGAVSDGFAQHRCLDEPPSAGAHVAACKTLPS